MNTQGEDFTAVAARIRMNMPSLTGTEAKVARTLTNYEALQKGTPIREVAEEAGVSEALVVKVSKKLGFDGFKEIKAALIGYRSGSSADLYDEISSDDDLDTVASKVFRTSIQALEETRAILDIEGIERTAKVLARAEKVDIYGVGGSAQIARDIAHKFLRIGRRIAVFDDPHMMNMSASVLDAADAVIAVSHSGNSEAVLAAAELARNNAATVIALSNYARSPLADIADITLASTALGGPLLGENAAARIAQLNIFDVVFVEVARLDGKLAELRLALTSKAVTNKRRS